MIIYHVVTFGGNDPEILKIFDDMPSQAMIQELADKFDCTVRVIEGIEVMQATSRTIEAEEAAWLAGVSDTLPGALRKEINRNRELLEIYRSIGAPGAFAMALIGRDIKEAEDALAAGDAAQMVRTLKILRENQA